MPLQNDNISPDGIPASGEIQSGDGVIAAASAPASIPADAGATTMDDSTEVSVDDFSAIKDSPLFSKEKEPEEKKEEVKLEDGAEKAPEKDEKKEEAKTPVKDDKTGKFVSAKISRDYSGIPEAMVPHFQRMGNEAFNAFKPIYIDYLKEHAELETLKKNPPVAARTDGLPESYYEHPEAYTLSQDYRQASNNANESQLVLEHWRDQLDAVRNGATDFTTLTRDPQSKQLVYGPKQTVDQRTQSYLESLFFNANNQATTFQQKLGAVQQQYNAKHMSLVNDIRGWEKNTFAIFEKADHPLQPFYKDTLSKFPPALQKNVLAQPLAKALVSINALMEMVKKGQTAATTSKTTEQKKQEAQKQAGPTSSGLSADTGSSNNDEISFDDFKKAKE